MVSTRRSRNVVEDSNALTLRSRTIDVESRHRTSTDGSHDNAETETPRKRGKMGSNLNEDADGAKTTSPAGEGLLTVIRPTADADESTSPTAAAPSPGPGSKDDIMEATGPSKRLDTLSKDSADHIHSGTVRGTHGIHKRFLSEEPEADMDKDSDHFAVALEDEMENAQAEKSDSAADASDDQGAPETFATNLKQTLPYTLAAKGSKPKKRKLAKSAPEDVDREMLPPVPNSQPDRPSGSGDSISPPASETVAAPRRPTNTARSASKEAKDVRKDGVIYRTISGKGMRGQMSSWLPTKVSQESRRIKDNLLVRKRVQEVCHGRRVKFVTSR